MMASDEVPLGRAEQPNALASTVQGAPSAVPSDYATVFTNAKAGMQGVDKEKVKQVVYEMSKDSPHFKEEQRKQVQRSHCAGVKHAILSALRHNCRCIHTPAVPPAVSNRPHTL